MRGKRVVTAALPYVNNLPHLGNLVGSLLSADVFSRYSRMRGHEVAFICGTDEYGTTTEISADKEGISPKSLCEKNSRKHKEVYDWFQIDFDSFGRTSCPEHLEATQEVFLQMHRNNCFTERVEKRFFCSRCSMFLADRYISGTCKECRSVQAKGDQCDGCGSVLHPGDIADPRCSFCGEAPAQKETKHLFFQLDRFQDRIADLVTKHSGNWTEAARNISLEWTRKELAPRCITRDLKYNWGVPVPVEGYGSKVMYVWFDAPVGYITFLRIIGKESWMYDPEVELYEFMGKDNVFFHSIFFPAMLEGSGRRYNYPKMISATQYLQYEGGKFSKSQNRGIFGHALLDNRMGPAGLWRFHLMRIRPEKGDSDFSWSEFYTSLNSILINTIGNFCYRVLSYLKQRGGNTLSEASLPASVKEPVSALLAQYVFHMERTEIKPAVERIVDMVEIGNKYVQQAFLHKYSLEQKKNTMSSAVNIILLLSRVMMPVTPEESAKLQRMLNVKEETIPDDFKEDLRAGHVLGSPSLLFSPLTKEQAEEVEKLCRN